MNRPCNSKIDCGDPQNPLSNFTSEAPDPILFYSSVYLAGNFQPALGSNFTASSCVGTCTGQTQEEADQCAEANYMACAANNNGVPPTNPLVDPPGTPPDNPAPTAQNTDQTCVVACPDGLTFSFTVPAGRFTALNQATANLMAHSYACQQVIQHRVCVGSLSPSECCVGSSFTATVVCSANHRPLSFSVVSGTLPSGLSLSVSGPSSFTISGTPTTSGTYSFRVRSTDPIGDFMDKLFTLTVLSIATASPLPNATNGTAYSEFITLSGTMQGTPVWTISAGSLPAGLALNSATGEISGTPTVSGNSSFTVSVTDSIAQCSKDFQLTVSGGCGLLPTLKASATQAGKQSTVAFGSGTNQLLLLSYDGTNTSMVLYDVSNLTVLGTNPLGARFGPPTGAFNKFTGKYTIFDRASDGQSATIYSGTITSTPTFTFSSIAWPYGVGATGGQGRDLVVANNTTNSVYIAIEGTLAQFNSATNTFLNHVTPSFGTFNLNGVSVNEATGDVYVTLYDPTTSIGWLYVYSATLVLQNTFQLPNPGHLDNAITSVYSPDSGLVYVTTRSDVAAVVVYAVNPGTGATAASIPVAGGFNVFQTDQIRYGFYDPIAHQVYVAIVDNVGFTSEVYVICADTNTLLGTANAIDGSGVQSFSYSDFADTMIVTRTSGFSTKIESYAP